MSTSIPLAALFPQPRSHVAARTYLALRRDGIEDLESLARVSAAHLLGLRAFGPRCPAEVERVLHAHGLSLKGGAS